MRDDSMYLEKKITLRKYRLNMIIQSFKIPVMIKASFSDYHYIYTVFEAQRSITRIIMRVSPSTNYRNMVRRTRVVSLSTCHNPPPPLPVAHPSPHLR